MYTEYYGFSHRPFTDPDRREGCLSPAFEAALDGLDQHLRDPQCGVLLFTGPAGSGKTAVLRRLLAGLPETVCPVLVWNAYLDFDELLNCLCDHLNLPTSPGGRECLPQVLETRLGERFETGGTVLLVLDDAHLLAGATLEGLHSLTQLQRAGRPLLRLLLAGGDELTARLREQPLEEYVGGHCRLPALDARQTQSYILAQLRAAGASDTLFSPAALETVARHSGGLPRLINLLCSQALLETFLAGWDTVSADCVAQAARGNPLPMGSASIAEMDAGLFTQALPPTEPAPAATAYPLAVVSAEPEADQKTSWRAAAGWLLATSLGGAAMGALLVLIWTGRFANTEAHTPAGPTASAEFAAVVTKPHHIEPSPAPAPAPAPQLLTNARQADGNASLKMGAPKEGAKPAPEVSKGESQEDSDSAVRVARLLEQAEEQLERLHYTRPAGNNALYSYRRVLHLDPDNSAARRGITRIKASFLHWADAARLRGDFSKARSLLQTALSIDPWYAPARRRLANSHRWDDDRVRRDADRPLEPSPKPPPPLRRQGFVNRD